MARSYDLDPIDGIAAGTIGPPGQRQFYLMASGRGESVALGCEKVHVQNLVLRIRQLLDAQELKPEPEPAPDPPVTDQPGTLEWMIGELGLGYQESRRMFVIVARQLQPDGPGAEAAAATAEATADSLATARFWATPEQLAGFARQAEAIVAAGRPRCPRCGLPVDPRGHPCPAANGSRPIV